MELKELKKKKNIKKAKNIKNIEKRIEKSKDFPQVGAADINKVTYRYVQEKLVQQDFKEYGKYHAVQQEIMLAYHFTSSPKVFLYACQFRPE